MNPFERLRDLVALTFGVPPDTITLSTTRDDLPAWDSVGHLNLMLALEDTFGLTLDIADMPRLHSVQAILDHLSRA